MSVNGFLFSFFTPILNFLLAPTSSKQNIVTNRWKSELNPVNKKKKSIKKKKNPVNIITNE